MNRTNFKAVLKLPVQGFVHPKTLKNANTCLYSLIKSACNVLRSES